MSKFYLEIIQISLRFFQLVCVISKLFLRILKSFFIYLLQARRNNFQPSGLTLTRKEKQMKMGMQLEDWARVMVDKEYDLTLEIQELQGKILQLRHKKKEIEYEMIEEFVKSDYHFLLKIDRKALQRFIIGDKI
jgi:hypothetical protein